MKIVGDKTATTDWTNSWNAANFFSCTGGIVLNACTMLKADNTAPPFTVTPTGTTVSVAIPRTAQLAETTLKFTCSDGATSWDTATFTAEVVHCSATLSSEVYPGNCDPTVFYIYSYRFVCTSTETVAFTSCTLTPVSYRRGGYPFWVTETYLTTNKALEVTLDTSAFRAWTGFEFECSATIDGVSYTWASN